MIDTKEAPDKYEAEAFNLFKKHPIDIFSNSWGPPDTALEIRGPKKLAKEALKKGVNEVQSYYYIWEVIIIFSNHALVIRCVFPDIGRKSYLYMYVLTLLVNMVT